jgi:hypothetical protein
MIRCAALAFLLALTQGSSEIEAHDRYLSVPSSNAQRNVEFLGSLPASSEKSEVYLKRRALTFKDQTPQDFNLFEENDTLYYKEKGNAANRYGVYLLTFGTIKFFAVWLFNSVSNDIRIGLPQRKCYINVDKEQGDSESLYIFKYDGIFLQKRALNAFPRENANLSFRIESAENENGMLIPFLRLYGVDDATRKSQLNYETGDYRSKEPNSLLLSILLEEFL